MAQLGAMLLPSWSHPATCIDSARCRACKEIKRLINLLDMDGTYGGWRASVGQQQAGMLGPGWPDLGPMQSNGPALTLPSGDIFHVRQYLREQPLRTQWVGAERPHLTALYNWWASAEVAVAERTPSERTLKSDMLAEFEYGSRTAKCWWAQTRGGIAGSRCSTTASSSGLPPGRYRRQRRLSCSSARRARSATSSRWK